MSGDLTEPLDIDGVTYRYVPLRALLPERELAAVPYSVRILLENVARTAPEALPDALARVRGQSAGCELPIHPNRVMLHDTTCLPALADLAALRDAVAERGGDPESVQPAVPVDLTVDHSVIVEEYGTPGALEHNLLVDFRRNTERYEFIKWAERTLRHFRVVPPGTGIIHQINMEALARVVWQDATLLHPDVLVATDSHTPMINSLGVLGWGVGGLQGQAAMLGEPVTIRFPSTVGVELTGRLGPGITGTDLALTLTELLRAAGVVDTFVEFFGTGLDELGWASRAAVANMAPEYGATCAFFPYDEQTAGYLRLTGRSEGHRRIVTEYLRAQGLVRTADAPVPSFDRVLRLDLATVEMSVAGPRQPHERRALSDVPASFRAAVPASAARHAFDARLTVPEGALAIAAITSCTNTANPALMIQAGLLARRAADAGLAARPWVKTSLSPGSRVVTRYLEEAGLLDALARTGFSVAGYGCMTCIGNSGPLHPRMESLTDEGFVPSAVVSGNRNYAGRIHPRVSAAYLASPPLVVAYALAGTVLHDFATTPLGHDHSGTPVFLRDLWPSDSEVAAVVASVVRPEAFAGNAASIRTGTPHWRELTGPDGVRFPWSPDSTYVRRPPYVTGFGARSSRVAGARVLLSLGDDISTDHISPAGAIPATSAAGEYLLAAGVRRHDLNQYSTRRSNHEVMLRGAFTNATVTNHLLRPGEGGPGAWARPAGGGVPRPVYEAARTYREAGVDLVILAGRNYGAGSSRDWAAKAQALLGVRVVVAESFERIHRGNLIGMGVLPMTFTPGSAPAVANLTGTETLTFEGLDDVTTGDNPIRMLVTGGQETVEVPLTLRVDTHHELSYLHHGGLLPYVLSRLTA
ncbi:MAG: aconitate hydratase AcnA [Actinoallomurus sp.]